MNKKTLIAAAYVRNSDPSKKDTEEQQAQVNALKAYAKAHGYELPDHLIFRDAISALKYPYWERAELMRLWDEAERGSFDIVLCTEFFRLARKSSEQYAIMEYLKRYRVEVESITEKFEDTAEGRLLHAVQGFLGEVEAEKIRLRTLRGKAHRAEKALTGQGSSPIYGYIFVDGVEYKKERYELNLKIIHVDSDGKQWTEITVIYYCFDECLKGTSLRRIALALTRMGIPTQRGRVAWHRATVRQILKREAYTGKAYNGQWTKDPETNKFTDKNVVPLPMGIYPQIISTEIYEQAQRQLEVNAEMSPRNNRHPQDYILRGMIYCGICNRHMHTKHFNKPKKNHTAIKSPEYRCYVNKGIDVTLHHHSTSLPIHTADHNAWEFAVPYIRNAELIRQHVLTMKEHVVQRDHSQDIERDVERIKKSIANLYRLAEAADPTDEDGMLALQDRLMTLERDKKEKEKLLGSVATTEEKQEKLLASLDRFEKWAATIRPFLDDLSYTISNEDKISALVILGVKVRVFPVSDSYPDRVVMSLLPPDIARFCDYDLTRPLPNALSQRYVPSPGYLVSDAP